ncbi:Ppx/GppA phosphatase family protein [Rosistilla carotiformis]|nr:Ppx/GppA phosphatase family protein [Rosistilla carotiformis]
MSDTTERSSSAGLLPPRTVAVIDIGATSIRMAVAEISDLGLVRTIDSLTRKITLGEDVFKSRQISRSSIEECVRILRSYQKVLLEYGITAAVDIRVVATSAVREAANRLAFLDRVYIATGLEVESIEEAEVNRITYMGIQPHLDSDPKLAVAKSVVVEVGGGSTEVLVVRSGNVLFSETHRLGSLRLAERLETLGAPGMRRRSIMETQIRQTVARIREQVFAEDGKIELIALGGDMRFAAGHILGDWDGGSLARVSVDALEALVHVVLQYNEDEIVQKLNVNFSDATTLGPALLSNLMLARSFQLDTVLVSDTNLRDGLLLEMASDGRWTAEFRNQILRSAFTLGRKCDFDAPYAKHVAASASLFFEQLKEEHQLDAKYEVMLHVAALLHEIGMFVDVRSNHKHAMYLIRNSEIFGLSRQDVLLVALVARYHRRAHPQPSHEGYGSLSRGERVAVAKMAALLRLAIAMHDSRSGRVQEFKCIKQRDRLVIEVARLEDVTLEQLAIRQNSTLFEEVFGLRVMVRGEQ